MARVCVVGAGPAGCVFSARMAQLGHEVSLIERLHFPRTRLGESLSPGVLPLLEMIGARLPVERAGFPRVRSVTTAWDGDVQERHDPEQRGLLVDRGRFDALLLARARALGVRVVQPASVRERRQSDGRWWLGVEQDGRKIEIEADFLTDASGRAGVLPSRRARHPVCTLALYAYWQGTNLPRQPRIEAGSDAWYWGVPLPDGRYNTLVFLDASRLRENRGRSLTGLFHEYLNRSGLMAGCSDPGVDSPVRATDATPYLDEESVTPWSIKVGDAALAVDPISSSGVQKAIQTALAGAVVANTLLRRSDSHAAAMQFYRTMIAQAAARHCGWAAAHYASVAARRGGPFWEDRAVGATPDGPFASGRTDVRVPLAAAVELSPSLAFVDMPCIDGEFVTVKAAVCHPALEGPLAYLGRWELAPLLRGIRAGMTPIEIVRSWADRMPLRSGLAIASWLLDQRILVAASTMQVSARTVRLHD